MLDNVRSAMCRHIIVATYRSTVIQNEQEKSVWLVDLSFSNRKTEAKNQRLKLTRDYTECFLQNVPK